MKIIKAWKFLKKEGASNFFKEIISRLNKFAKCALLSTIAIPIAIAFFIISPWIHIRLIRLYSNRIGHYALHTEQWLCLLDMLSEKKIKTLYFPISATPCNIQL